jgi:hypothetical protein
MAESDRMDSMPTVFPAADIQRSFPVNLVPVPSGFIPSKLVICDAIAMPISLRSHEQKIRKSFSVKEMRQHKNA